MIMEGKVFSVNDNCYNKESDWNCDRYKVRKYILDSS